MLKYRASKRRDDVILDCSILSDDCARSLFTKDTLILLGLGKSTESIMALPGNYHILRKKITPNSIIL